MSKIEYIKEHAPSFGITEKDILELASEKHIDTLFLTLGEYFKHLEKIEDWKDKKHKVISSKYEKAIKSATAKFKQIKNEELLLKINLYKKKGLKIKEICGLLDITESKFLSIVGNANLRRRIK